MTIRKHVRRSRLSTASARTRKRRRAGKRRERTIGGIPISELGRRIIANAKNELADIIRESYWKAKGEAVWRAVCRESLRLRCANTWVEVVRRIGRA